MPRAGPPLTRRSPRRLPAETSSSGSGPPPRHARRGRAAADARPAPSGTPAVIPQRGRRRQPADRCDRSAGAGRVATGGGPGRLPVARDVTSRRAAPSPWAAHPTERNRHDRPHLARPAPHARLPARRVVLPAQLGRRRRPARGHGAQPARAARPTPASRRRSTAWKQLDPTLKALAEMAAAVSIGCSWCVDFGYWISTQQGRRPGQAARRPAVAGQRRLHRPGAAGHGVRGGDDQPPRRPSPTRWSRACGANWTTPSWSS